jgi:cytochrome c553
VWGRATAPTPLFAIDTKIEDDMNNAKGLGAAAAIALAAALVTWSAGAAEMEGAAAAVGGDVEAGKRVWNQTAGCTRCHGWSGDGTPEGPGYPTGANLRKATFDADTLKERIKCGVPGSEMPSFNRNAYGTLPCYGMTAAQIGAQKPPQGEVSLTDAQVENLVAYLLAKVVNKPVADKAVCVDYYGPTNAICNRFP